MLPWFTNDDLQAATTHLQVGAGRLRWEEMPPWFCIAVSFWLLSAIQMFSASAPAFRWGQLIDGGVRGYGLAVDEDENCYVAGSLLGATALFGANVATNVAMGRSDVFVAKFDRHGSNLWVKTAGGDQSEEGRGIAVDKCGNVYVAGHINSPVATFGATNLTRQGNQDAFLAKYDTDGNFVWVQQGRNAPGLSAYGSAVFV